MKLGSRSKIASLHMYTLRDFDMWKRHAVELLRQFCRLMQRFFAADGCHCFDVLAFSSSTSLTSVHRHPKCTRTVFSQRVRFLRAPPMTDCQGFRERRRRERRKIGDLRETLRKIFLKCRSRVHYSQILGSIPNSLL